jgi:hypothetical protein
MSKMKSCMVLLGIMAVSVGLLTLSMADGTFDGRFVLTACSVLLAELYFWSAAVSPFAGGQWELQQTAPLHAGMVVLAVINAAGALVIVLLFLAGCGYTALVIGATLLLLFFVLGASTTLAAQRKVAAGGRNDDVQNAFMQLFRLKLHELAEKTCADLRAAEVVHQALRKLCEECRYAALQSPQGAELINDELGRMLEALESSLNGVDSSRMLEQIGRIGSGLKRRESIIKQLASLKATRGASRKQCATE